MRILWKVINWSTFTGLPACLAYFADFGGFATRLDSTLTSIEPVLSALMPFAAIMIGSASAAAIVKYSWTHGRKKYLDLRYANVREFRACRGAIAECKIGLVRLHDTPRFMLSQGEFVGQHARLKAEMFQLFNQLAGLGIWVPDTVGIEDQQARSRLIGYLTILESFAARSNLQAAQTAVFDDSQATNS